MSRDNLWQICHKNEHGNKSFTASIVKSIRMNGLTSKQIAGDISISTERVRNWFYKNTGMTAFDLVLLMREYDFIRSMVTDITAESRLPVCLNEPCE